MRRIMPGLAVCCLVPAALTAAAETAVTNRNAYGEEEVRWSRDGVLFRHEIFLKQQRPLAFPVPALPAFELVLHFPNGRVLHDRYRNRVLLERETGFPSGLRSLVGYEGGREAWKELRYPPGDGPQDGQIIRTWLAADGKRKLKERTQFKNGAVVEDILDPRERLQLRTITIPGGDRTVKQFRNGVLFEETVTTPEGGVILSRFDDKGKLASRRTTIRGWERTIGYGPGGVVSGIAWSRDGLSVVYAPTHTNTAALRAAGPAGSVFSLAFAQDLLFEEDLFKGTNRMLTVACIPAERLVFQAVLGGVTNIREVWQERVLRERATAVTNRGSWSLFAERFDKFGKVEHSRFADSRGVVTVRVREINRWEEKTTRGGVLAAARTEFENGSVRILEYDKGVLVRETLLDKESPMFKFIRIFENGVLRWKEEYYLGGRLVRTRYDAAGKQTGLFWSRWQ